MKHTMQYSSRLSRFATVALPVLSIALVGYMGSILFNTSHATELTPTSSSLIVPAAGSQLPTNATSACCNVRVNKVTRPVNNAERIILNISIKNTLHNILQISPGLQMSLHDTAGKSYDYTAAYLPVEASVGGPLPAGAERTEDFDFDIPVNSIPHTVIFQPDASAAPLTIGLPL